MEALVTKFTRVVTLGAGVEVYRLNVGFVGEIVEVVG